MKYIRTKDGIYETYENGETYNGFGCKSINETIKIHKKDIVKQADTIEELIMPQDLLFLIDKNGNKIPFYVENVDYLNAWLRTHDIYKIEELYINNGKNYMLVAEMNKEGELELL